MHVYRILFFAFFFCSSLSLRAQSNNPVGGHFGIKVGASLTKVAISGTTVNIPKQNLDPMLGIMYRYRLRKFVIQPEVLATIKGGSFQVVQTNGRQTIDNSYQYISVPLLLGYIPTEGLTLQAGPEVSYALNSGKTNGPGSSTDYGVVVGAHYDFLDLLDKASLHVRYIYGLANVSPDPAATYQNRVFQVSLVYNLYPKPKRK